MPVEHRRSRRFRLSYRAWIASAGARPQPCALVDISDSGARLRVENPDAVPERFAALFTTRGEPRRRCRVVWRSPKEIGVVFENHSPMAARDRRFARALQAQKFADLVLAI